MDFDNSATTLEFFNFTPEQLSAERDHLVKSLIKRAIESAMQKIETPATTALLAQKKDAVMCLMQEACAKKLDCLRQLDKKTFEVPSHVLLIKDFDLEQQLTSAEEQAKFEQLEELKLRYRENMAMLAELVAEQEKFTAIEPLIEQELQVHQLLYEACANSDHKNIHKFAHQLVADMQNEKSDD
ncbi:hypothetical protein ACLKA7_004776 [Drosophila subpalustris]